MGKRRPSNMSSRQLELIKEPPNIAQSIYDANRKESTVKQDSYKLESIELLFGQLKNLHLRTQRTEFLVFCSTKTP